MSTTVKFKEDHEHGEPKHHGHHKKPCRDHREHIVLVKVEYVGKTTWVEGVIEDTPLFLIKQNAMRFFELDLSQQHCYVLQVGDVDFSDDAEIDCFEDKEITFSLALKDECNKG